MNEINHVDLAFVVDTTGSMGPFIAAAKAQMIVMVKELAAAAKVSMRLGLVQYRDHPPQDQLVYKAEAFTEDLAAAQKGIAALKAEGGGDGPEAVLDGVRAACADLKWRPHARRLAVLIGDAPPHGVGFAGDAFRTGCPCGQTIESVTATAEETRVTVYALGLTPYVADSFGKLARYTGGDYFASAQGPTAIETIKRLIVDEFGNLELDRRVLEAWMTDAEFSIDATAERLGCTSGEVGASVTRLSARRLVQFGAAPIAASR
jgi:Mg-chelatase subunit ChlD